MGQMCRKWRQKRSFTAVQASKQAAITFWIGCHLKPFSYHHHLHLFKHEKSLQKKVATAISCYVLTLYGKNASNFRVLAHLAHSDFWPRLMRGRWGFLGLSLIGDCIPFVKLLSFSYCFRIHVLHKNLWSGSSLAAAVDRGILQQSL